MTGNGNNNRSAANAVKKNTSSFIPTSSRRNSTSTSSPNPQGTSDSKKKKAPKPSAGEDEQVDVDTVDTTNTRSSTDHRNRKDCPCGKSTEAGVWLIDCSKCRQYWHVDCVSLSGLSEQTINKLVDYLCPFCYVPPVPVSYPNFKVDLCYFCQSTVTLQMANNLSETAIASEKLKTISSFAKELAKIDFDSVKNSLSAVQDLDVHLKHLLLNQDDLKAHQKRTERIEAHLGKISKSIDPKEQKVAKESIDTLSQHVQQLQDQLSAFTQSAPPLRSTEPSATDQLLEHISDQLEKLSNQSIPQPCSEPSHPPPPSRPCTPNYSNLEKPVHMSRENYIDPQLETQLMEYFESCKSKFHEEGDRACLSFGESYKYSGSRSGATPLEIPPLLQSLMNQINSDFTSADQPKINSCLVNCYTGPNSSLPQHSDDEQSIHPESLIHTVSLGASCTIAFIEKHSSSHASHDHECQPRSIYSMTRSSQELFTHGINKDSISSGKRYSITFRSVSFKNRNSTCIIGDSNTCGLKFGSDPKKSFGQWMPGKQVFTPVIEDIDPQVARGYRNIVVHCAINNLKKDEVKNLADIKRVFSMYVNKIECIQAVNPKAHVFICPPLPSKRAELNRKSLYFIKLIREELIPSNFGVTLVDGIDGFLDEAGLLSQHLSRNLNRYQKPDYLHLNWKGLAKLGVLIRNTVLLRMNGGKDRRRRSSRNNGQTRTGQTEGYAGTAANGFGHNSDGYQSS